MTLTKTVETLWEIFLVAVMILLSACMLFFVVVAFSPEAEARVRAVPVPVAGPTYPLKGQAVADDVATQVWVLAITVDDPADVPDFIRVWRLRNDGYYPVVSLPTFGNPQRLRHAAVPIPTGSFCSGDIVMLEYIPGVSFELWMFGSYRGERVGGFTVP